MPWSNLVIFKISFFSSKGLQHLRNSFFMIFSFAFGNRFRWGVSFFDVSARGSVPSSGRTPPHLMKISSEPATNMPKSGDRHRQRVLFALVTGKEKRNFFNLFGRKQEQAPLQQMPYTLNKNALNE